MANNAGFQGQSHLPEPPPPYSPHTPPPQPRANIPPAAVYIPPASPQYPAHGTSLQGTLTNVGKEVGGYLKGLTKAGVKAISKALDHPNLDSLRTGNVIQLVSRSTGRTLQILQAPDGRLVLDGQGGEGHQFYNAHFTVVQDTDNYIMLHNNFNYLAVKDGITQMYAAGPSGIPTPPCRFKIREVLLQTQFVTIESVPERGKFVAVLPNGQVKSALVATAADQDSHFALRLIYNSGTAQVHKKK